MADTIISTDGLTNLNNMIKDDQYENTLRSFTNKDYLSDKLTQLDSSAEARHNDALNKNNAAHQRIDDEIRASDSSNEIRSNRTTDTILADGRYIDANSQRRSDAQVLASANNASATAAQADRVAQAQVLAATLNAQNLTAQASLNAQNLNAAVESAKDEATTAAQAAVVAGYLARELAASEGAATRALINSQYADGLRDKLSAVIASEALLRGEVRHWEHEGRRFEREIGQYGINNLSNQVAALHSQFQSATQGTVNFGSMSGNAGRNTSTNNVV